MINPKILLIGCGLHAKRVYLPILKELQNTYGESLKAVVELKDAKESTTQKINEDFNNIEFCFVEQMKESFTQSLPESIESELDKVLKSQGINAVIIATDPLHHVQYALWALKNNLHILMDKPISTYKNVANSVTEAKKLICDYELLLKNYNSEKAFIVNSQRRFLPQFQMIQNLVNDVAEKFGVPITSIQSTHCDGQWRLPNEIFEIDYHSYLGAGKISHSGYHFIDFAIKMVKDSYISAGKYFNKISVFSKFIKPSGLLKLQNQNDLNKLFNGKYSKVKKYSDEQLVKKLKDSNEAEVDDYSIITLMSDKSALTTITLNLIHNGFSRRSWLMPNLKDLYKGNGRVRHEYHNIEQGSLQNIQIHSYQSKDNHNFNDENDLKVGGNNHYDIYIFRNSDLIGGEPFTVISAKDIEEKYSMDKSKVMNELARHEAVKQFFDVVVGNKKVSEIKSNITDHYLSVKLMSMMYISGKKNKEVIDKIKIFDDI